MDGIAKQAVGKSYSDMYREWHAALERSYAAFADTLRARGLTAPETLTATGRHAWYPRVAPDNRRVAYADENGREVTATRIIDVATRSAAVRSCSFKRRITSSRDRTLAGPRQLPGR